MKKFLKVLFSIFSFFATAVGLLAIVDKLTNKNRIDGDYLDCSKTEENVD